MRELETLLFIIVQVVGFCTGCLRRGVECPNYKVLSRNSEYEERQYPEIVWVSTTKEGPSLPEASRVMYRKLFAYTQGENIKGMTLNATTPVRTRIVPCHGATCLTIFVMSFPLPSDVADNPPYPNDPTLFIEKDPPLRYIVRGFDGRPDEQEWIEQAHRLGVILRKDNSVEKSYYHAVWYDPPFQLFHRLNEIWMVKKGEILIKPGDGPTDKPKPAVA